MIKRLVVLLICTFYLSSCAAWVGKFQMLLPPRPVMAEPETASASSTTPTPRPRPVSSSGSGTGAEPLPQSATSSTGGSNGEPTVITCEIC